MVLFLGQFWDLIPTVIKHQYYCSTKSGLWIYKDPEKLLVDNPDFLEKNNSDEYFFDLKNNNNNESYSPRIREEFYQVKAFDHAIGKQENIIRDTKNNEILVIKIDFFLGSGMGSIHGGGSLESWRKSLVFGWIENRGCKIFDDSKKESYFSISREFLELMKE